MSKNKVHISLNNGFGRKWKVTQRRQIVSTHDTQRAVQAEKLPKKINQIL